MEAALYNGSRHLCSTGCRTVNKVPLTTMINTPTLKIFKKYSRVSQLLETHMKLKLILWFFIFFSWYYSLTMEFLRYFWEQKITPKKQSWSPRHVEKMMHYTSQKIAPFQALISSKLYSVQSWHLFCQPKTVSFTNPQVHGPPQILYYIENLTAYKLWFGRRKQFWTYLLTCTL